MSPDNGGKYTEFGATASAKCCCCGSGNAGLYVYPLELITRMLCIDCVRGATMAVAREVKRRGYQPENPA